MIGKANEQFLHAQLEIAYASSQSTSFEKNMSISERLRAEQRLLVSFEHTVLLRKSRKCQAGL